MHLPLIEDLAAALGVAAITTLLCRLLKQPAVLGYLIAGVIIGPHTPIPLFADPERIQVLSELGVILVMFSIGLELRIRTLWRIMPVAGLMGLIQISTMMSLGYIVATAIGLSAMESLVCAAMVAISSTMVASKALADHGSDQRLTTLVFGVLVIQDLSAIVLIALLTALATAQTIPANVLASSMVELGAFLIFIVVGGFLLVPRFIRLIIRLDNRETLLVASIGLCFGMAILAERAGYSVALGALLAGLLTAESGHGVMIEELVKPLRDIFAAVFFVTVGMSANPYAVLDSWPLVLMLTAVVLVGMTVSIAVGGFLTGNRVILSLRAGMSLAQIGEFSFIIVSVGVAAGVVQSSLYPVAVAIAVLTAFTTPLMVRASTPVALWVDRHLPHPIQTFAALYGAWIESLRAGGKPRSRERMLVRFLLVDAVCLTGLALLASLLHRRIVAALQTYAEVPPVAGRWIMVAAALVLSGPFWVGIVRSSRNLGALILTRSSTPGAIDLANAPRRAFIVTLQLIIVVMVGAPVMALMQAVVPIAYGATALGVVVLILSISFWRSATNLHQHVKAGAQLVIEILQRQSGMHADNDAHAHVHAGISTGDDKATLADVRLLLPGLGALSSVQLKPDSPIIGKTLAEINLRGATGANVIAITRRSGTVVTPTGREPLDSGDVLALTGAQEAIDQAQRILHTLELDTPEDPETATATDAG